MMRMFHPPEIKKVWDSVQKNEGEGQLAKVNQILMSAERQRLEFGPNSESQVTLFDKFEMQKKGKQVSENCSASPKCFTNPKLKLLFLSPWEAMA